jgi:hypothetical protein
MAPRVKEAMGAKAAMAKTELLATLECAADRWAGGGDRPSHMRATRRWSACLSHRDRGQRQAEPTPAGHFPTRDPDAPDSLNSPQDERLPS